MTNQCTNPKHQQRVVAKFVFYSHSMAIMMHKIRRNHMRLPAPGVSTSTAEGRRNALWGNMTPLLCWEGKSRAVCMTKGESSEMQNFFLSTMNTQTIRGSFQYTIRMVSSRRESPSYNGGHSNAEVLWENIWRCHGIHWFHWLIRAHESQYS